jgi:ribosomal protein L37AE/L43A
MTDRELAGCALLPCPFCGGTSLTVYADGVWCEQCSAHHDVDPPSEAEAIAAWNRRTPSREGVWCSGNS